MPDSLTLVGIVIALIALVVSVWVGYHTVIPARDRLRRDFLALQPDLRIASAPAGGHPYTVDIRLDNLGVGPAYDGTITMGGWSGEARVQIFPTLRPGHVEYRAQVVLGHDSPIRTTLVPGARVRVKYRDRWHNWSEVTYPVLQTRRDDGRFNIGIQTELPTVERHPVPLRKMRRYLRETPNP